MNYFYYQPGSIYPHDYYYRPSSLYPEYPYKENGVSEEKNYVYDMIRCIFLEMELDKEHIGSPQWNPLGAYIRPGDTVLVKPNLVHHYNYGDNGLKNGLECLVTHPSVIRCVLDYVLIALKGEGKIILGDAPVQECIFPRLIDVGGYHRIEKFYRQIPGFAYDIKFKDFRNSYMITGKWGMEQRKRHNPDFKGTFVDLGGQSYFVNRDERKLRITNYEPWDTVSAHCHGMHQYYLSQACLHADIIINLPKPKTHRLAGMTGAMKNLIGLNALKEFLPHYSKGAVGQGGDAYPCKDIKKDILYGLTDFRNWCYKKDFRKISGELTQFIDKALHSSPNKEIDFGAWRGNDTIWRTVLDVAYAVLYADKTGKLQKDIQRKIITFGDMIVSGEKNGPLTPLYKEIGGILFSDNIVEFDYFLCELMGFNYRKIPIMQHSLRDYKLYAKKSLSIFKSNNTRFTGKEILRANSLGFLAHDEWKNYVEKE